MGARVLFFCIFASASCVWASPPDQIKKLIEEIGETAVKSDETVGLSIAVAQGDSILFSGGFGFANVELQSAATPKTVYRIGSITKQFTAAAILLLAENGKLKLDDALSKHVPAWPEKKHVVTLRHLLQHTSGIKSFTGLPSYRELMRKDVAHKDILARFADRPLAFKPGTKYVYCNSGFYLLGMVIENISGKKYESFLQDEVFSILGLEHTYYDRSAKIIPGRSQGYTRWDGALKNARYLSMTQPFAAGALASTAEDLVLWQQALVNHRLLSKASYQQMTTPGVLASGMPINYGLGAALRTQKGRPTIGHEGGINGFRSSLVYYPDSKLTIVVLANSERVQPAAVSSRIAKLVLGREESDEAK